MYIQMCVSCIVNNSNMIGKVNFASSNKVMYNMYNNLYFFVVFFFFIFFVFKTNGRYMFLLLQYILFVNFCFVLLLIMCSIFAFVWNKYAYSYPYKKNIQKKHTHKMYSYYNMLNMCKKKKFIYYNSICTKWIRDKLWNVAALGCTTV